MASSSGSLSAMSQEDLTPPASAAQQKQASTVHYLPCGIKYDGPTEVNSYFLIKKEKNGELVSHLRGRELKGKTVPLPKDVQGLCITPGDDNPLRWEVTGEFDAMTLWQHDLPPDVAQMDEYLNLFEVLSSIHS